MKQFDQNEFNRFILENEVIGFFDTPITLKSGRQSNWYVNWRTITEDVFLTEKLSDFLISFIVANELRPDCIYGVPEGATKLGIISQCEWAKSFTNYNIGSHVLAMGRGKPKDHGDPKDRYFLGMPKGKIAIVEDVTTTGGSLLFSIDQIAESGGEVIVAISLTDRMERRDDGTSVRQAVEEKGIRYAPMSSALQLLPAASEKYNIGAELRRFVEEEFEKYGTEPISLRRTK